MHETPDPPEECKDMNEKQAKIHSQGQRVPTEGKRTPVFHALSSSSPGIAFFFPAILSIDLWMTFCATCLDLRWWVFACWLNTSPFHANLSPMWDERRFTLARCSQLSKQKKDHTASMTADDDELTIMNKGYILRFLIFKYQRWSKFYHQIQSWNCTRVTLEKIDPRVTLNCCGVYLFWLREKHRLLREYFRVTGMFSLCLSLLPRDFALASVERQLRRWIDNGTLVTEDSVYYTKKFASEKIRVKTSEINLCRDRLWETQGRQQQNQWN